MLCSAQILASRQTWHFDEKKQQQQHTQAFLNSRFKEEKKREVNTPTEYVILHASMSACRTGSTITSSTSSTRLWLDNDAVHSTAFPPTRYSIKREGGIIGRVQREGWKDMWQLHLIYALYRTTLGKRECCHQLSISEKNASKVIRIYHGSYGRGKAKGEPGWVIVTLSVQMVVHSQGSVTHPYLREWSDEKMK